MAVSYDVIAKTSVGPIRFGMSPEEVHAAMGDMPERLFRRSKSERYETEGYHQNTVQIHYDGDSPSVNFVELAGAGEMVAVFCGIPVFQTKVDHLISLLSEYDDYDQSAPEPEYMYIYRNLDISLWRPVVPENDERSNRGSFSQHWEWALDPISARPTVSPASHGARRLGNYRGCAASRVLKERMACCRPSGRLPNADVASVFARLCGGDRVPDQDQSSTTIPSILHGECRVACYFDPDGSARADARYLVHRRRQDCDTRWGLNCP